MTFKESVTSEIDLSETPPKFREVALKQLENEDSELIKVVRRITYPYIDKSREMIVYKAYIVRMNLMTLVSQHGETSETVSVDRMVAGDCIEFVDYWYKKFPR